jgi:uncharacterized repeat protein (TIGR01451 family)
MVKVMRNHPLLLTFLVAAVLAVGLLLMAAPSADSQESSQSCDPLRFCLEKSVEDPVTVGEQVTFTITAFCGGRSDCLAISPGVEDTLPASVEFVSAEASGLIPAECVESGGTVTCSPESFDQDTPFVAEIVVIPTRCGTFTNTARELFPPEFDPQTVSLDFTVVGCEEEAPAPAPAPAPITQEGEQESESGEIDQTFEVS